MRRITQDLINQTDWFASLKDKIAHFNKIWSSYFILRTAVQNILKYYNLGRELLNITIVIQKLSSVNSYTEVPYCFILH